MSLSGSSASRNSICAMTRLASSSSMNVGRKMIRSLSRREKMSNARSPRGVCSMTIGTRAMLLSFYRLASDGGAPAPRNPKGRTTTLRTNGCVFDQEVERLAFAEPQTERLEVAALLHHTPHGGCRAPARAGDLLHLGLHLVVARRQPFLAGDRLQQQRAFDALLGAGPQLAHELGDVPLHTVGIDALPPQPLARVLDLVRDLPHHQGIGHRELVALQHGAHDLVLQLAPLLGLAPGFELPARLGTQRVDRLELAERFREVVVERGQDLFLDLARLQRRGAALAAQRLDAVILGTAEG